MSPSDVEAVAALCRQLASEARNWDGFEKRVALAFSDPRHALIVAVDETGKIVAWMHLHETFLVAAEPCLQVLALVVDQECRGRGVGKEMMAFAEKEASARGLPRVYLHSQIKRTDAHKFYEDLGYSQLKTQVVFEKRL